MRKLVLTLALLAIATAVNAQSNEVVTSTQPLTGSAVNPCNGEPLVYEGQCHYVTRTNATITDVHANCHADAIGAFGTEYMFGLTSRHRTEALACGSSEQFTKRTRLITSRSAPNAFITVRFLLTTDANCQPQVVVNDTDADCRGRNSSGF